MTTQSHTNRDHQIGRRFASLLGEFYPKLRARLASQPSKHSILMVALPERYWYVRVDLIVWSKPNSGVKKASVCSYSFLMRDNGIAEMRGTTVFEIAG